MKVKSKLSFVGIRKWY